MPIYREVDLVVAGDNREMHCWLVGWVKLADLQRAGSVRLVGPMRLAQAVIV